jgi:hypothetical protein
VFGRVEADRLCLDVRTITDAQVPALAAAFGRLAAEHRSTEHPVLHSAAESKVTSSRD